VTVLDTFAEKKGTGVISASDGVDDKDFTADEGRGLEMTPVPFSSHGEVQVVSRVVGFKKIKFYTNENVGSGELDLPEQQMHTTSYWLTIPATVMGVLPYASDDRRDGVVGLAFAMRQVAQLLLMCDRNDIGISIAGEEDGLEKGPYPFSVKIFVYDNYPGGIGFSEPLYRMDRELLESTRALIASCDCENGCPGCVGPIGNTGPLAKTAALAILNRLLAEALAA
jgi:DEAD/DEAH box helicase domain-containing protein